MTALVEPGDNEVAAQIAALSRLRALRMELTIGSTSNAEGAS